MAGSLLEVLTEHYVLWFTVFVGLACYLVRHSYSYWAVRGVPYSTPVPFFGNARRYLLLKTPFFRVHDEIYKKFKGSPFYGFYEFFHPELVLRDPQLIEQVMIRDFPMWMDRGNQIDTNLEPLSNHLVNLTGSKWRSLRVKLTPVFSSGKLKTMIGQLVTCSDVIVQYLEKNWNSGPIEVKDKMSGLTLDVIGSCAFGLDLNVIENPDSAFLKLGKKIFEPSKMGRLRRFIRNAHPSLLSLLGWKGMPKKLEDFFINTVKDTIKHREDNKVLRNDFIQLMMEIRNQEAKSNSSDEIVLDEVTFAANAFVFLLAGFETTATTMGYLLYELSTKPHVQDKLYSEAVEVMKKHNSEVTWDSIKDLTYLDQCISETLRKHPPVPAVRRVNKQPYKIPNSNLELPAGSIVMIPIYSLHHDPLYYPNPEEFIPERFSEENKQKQVKCTYLPFGEGPRICIGLRFAKLEIKVAMLKMITKFSFKLNPRTKEPLEFSATALLSGVVGGIWIDFVPRKIEL